MSEASYLVELREAAPKAPERLRGLVRSLPAADAALLAAHSARDLGRDRDHARRRRSAPLSTPASAVIRPGT